VLHLSFLLLTYVALVVETSPAMHASPLQPTALWCAAALAIWIRPGNASVFWCSAAGLASDLLSQGPLGPGLAIGAAVGWVLSIVRVEQRLDSAPAFFLLVVVLGVVGLAGPAAVRHLFSQRPIDATELLRNAVSRACVTGLTGTLLFVVGRSFLPRSNVEKNAWT
jgi:hypothetical protein